MVGASKNVDSAEPSADFHPAVPPGLRSLSPSEPLKPLILGSPKSSSSATVVTKLDLAHPKPPPSSSPNQARSVSSSSNLAEEECAINLLVSSGSLRAVRAASMDADISRGSVKVVGKDDDEAKPTAKEDDANRADKPPVYVSETVQAVEADAQAVFAAEERSVFYHQTDLVVEDFVSNSSLVTEDRVASHDSRMSDVRAAEVVDIMRQDEVQVPVPDPGWEHEPQSDETRAPVPGTGNDHDRGAEVRTESKVSDIRDRGPSADEAELEAEEAEFGAVEALDSDMAMLARLSQLSVPQLGFSTLDPNSQVAQQLFPGPVDPN